MERPLSAGVATSHLHGRRGRQNRLHLLGHLAGLHHGALKRVPYGVGALVAKDGLKDLPKIECVFGFWFEEFCCFILPCSLPLG